MNQYQTYNNQKQPIYYGYIVVAAASLIQGISWGANRSFGVFLAPMLDDFGWTRAGISGAFTLIWFVMGIATIFAGKFVDLVGPRLVLTFCGILLGAGYLLTSFVNDIWQFYLTYGLIAGIRSLYLAGFHRGYRYHPAEVEPGSGGAVTESVRGRWNPFDLCFLMFYLQQLLTRFRKRLEAMQGELIGNDQKGRESTRTVNLDQSRVGRLSRMDAMQGQAVAVEAQRRRRIRMESVKKALDRIEAGNYGICISCEEDIDPRRLEFDPAAALCISCARAEEGP